MRDQVRQVVADRNADVSYDQLRLNAIEQRFNFFDGSLQIHQRGFVIVARGVVLLERSAFTEVDAPIRHQSVPEKRISESSFVLPQTRDVGTFALTQTRARLLDDVPLFQERKFTGLKLRFRVAIATIKRGVRKIKTGSFERIIFPHFAEEIEKRAEAAALRKKEDSH